MLCAKLLQLCSTLCNPMTCTPPGPLCMGFSRQEYWSGFPCPPPGDLPDLWHHTRPDFERRLWDLYMRGTWRKGEERTSGGRGSVKCPSNVFWLSDAIIMQLLRTCTMMPSGSQDQGRVTSPVTSRGASQHGPQVCWGVKEAGIWKK